MTANPLHEIASSSSWEELRSRFADYLGLHEPVPPGALRRALEDKRFGDYLIVCRGHEGYLRKLLDDPANAKYEVAPPSAVPEKPAAGHSTPALLARASKSFVKWGTRGFTQVDEDEFARRYAICQTCPLLQEPPDRTVYGLVARSGRDNRICGGCGCPVVSKARRPSERCPSEDPSDPTRTRWGEPRHAVAEPTTTAEASSGR